MHGLDARRRNPRGELHLQARQVAGCCRYRPDDASRRKLKSVLCSCTLEAGVPPGISSKAAALDQRLDRASHAQPLVTLPSVRDEARGHEEEGFVWERLREDQNATRCAQAEDF